MTAPDERDLARGYLRKANEDLSAVGAFLGDSGVSDGILGCHAQQAVEKALKAVLAAAGAEVPHVHALGFLLERLAEAGVEVPGHVDEADWLGPWAVEFRYPDVADETLDREAAFATAANVYRWASSLVD